MRRAVRYLAYALAGLVALVVLVVAIVLIGANTEPGRRLIETQTRSLTGGMVELDGLHGRFPDRLRLRTIRINDADGTWLTITDAALDWHPLRLILTRTIDIERLGIAAIAVARKPVPAPAKKPAATGKGGLNLPLGLRLSALDIGRIELAAPVIGHAARVSVTGHAAIASLAPILTGPGLDNLPRGSLALALADLDAGGSYTLSGDLHDPDIALHLHVHEPAGGLVATLAHSNQISPLALDLDLAGPKTAETLNLALKAGPLDATATGRVDLVGRTLALDLAAHAPAMTPVPGVSWARLDLDTHVAGPFTRPDATGHLDLEQLAAGGAEIGAIRATLSGNQGRAAIEATLDRLRIPGPKPDLLASDPVRLSAQATLSDPARPVTFSVTHPLIRLTGHATTASPIAAHLDLVLPQLGPLAAAGGQAIEGHAHLTADLTSEGPNASANVAAHIAVTEAKPPIQALLGPDATLTLVAHKAGSTLTLDHLTLDGAAIALAAHGSRSASGIDAGFHLALPDLAKASPAASGHLTVDGTATGPLDDFAATLHAAGIVGATGIPQGPITLDLDATHLPKAPEATLALTGRLDAAPVTVAANVTRSADGATAVSLKRLDWKSLAAHAELALAPGGKIPTGTIDLRFAHLADLDRLAHRDLAGSLAARIDSTPSEARLDLALTDLAAAGVTVGKLTLAGTVRTPATRPVLDLALDVAAAHTGTLTANAQATARGPLDALDLALAAQLPDLQGAPATLRTTARLDQPKSTVSLRTLTADWHRLSLALQSPATITYAPAVSIRGLDLALAAPAAPTATLRVDGTVSPKLALDVDLQNVTPALAKPFAPTLNATGTIAATAHLRGTPAAPTGTIRLTADALRDRAGPAAALPPGNLAADITLHGTTANLSARLDAGPKIALRVDGTVPLKPAAPLDVRTDGTIDLSVANPILEQQGRHAAGTIAIDARATGTTRSPNLDGRIRLTNGDLQDFAQGAHLARMDALVTLAGRTVTVDHFTADAGKGSLRLAGTVGALEPTLPVDLHLTMHDASPISSDLLTAVLDADLRVTGSAKSRLDVAGRATIVRADINIPNSLPPSVATLHVIRPGDKPPAPPAPNAPPALAIGLDLDVDAPGQIFIRGHGLNATLGGTLHVGGTAKHPEISGGFHLRRGSFSLAGTNLTFTKGEVGFNGTTNGKLDPSIDFVAEQQVQQYDAKLEVTGYASKPEIKLSSTPPLPQDQILGLLLFGSTTANLSPLQIAQIAGALASLSSGGGGFDPLGKVRSTLGLDRLTIGSGTSGSGKETGASIEGGKYVTKRVYVGARQSTGGGGTQAIASYDITKRLKAFATVGTGGTVTGATTPQNDPGSTIGLKYQFRY